MGKSVFDGDKNARDAEYLAWMRNNPGGFVGNFSRGDGSTYCCLHKAGCRHIKEYIRSKRLDCFTTGPYIKVCANSIDEIVSWAKANRPRMSKALIPCKTCSPLSVPR